MKPEDAPDSHSTPTGQPPTEQELEILEVIWEASGPVTVRDVYEVLLERRKVAYTTVMTMMGIMEKKGHLERHKDGRAYVYRPLRSRGQTLTGMVRDFVERVFDGSARPLLLTLAEDEQISEDDLDEIRQRIREIDE